MIYATLFAALGIVSASANRFYSEDVRNVKRLFENFKRDHGKYYETMDVEIRRYYQFLENLQVIDARNEAEIKAGGSAVHGITKFSDLSVSEFRKQFLTADVSSVKKTATDIKLPIVIPPIHLGRHVDWTGKYTTTVKDQGYCGSCWAFSATEQIESDAMRELGADYVLSTEQSVECSANPHPCGSGWVTDVYDYVKRVPLETESDYPYTSYNGAVGTCEYELCRGVIGITGYTILSGGESAMAEYVLNTGPLSVCLNGDAFQTYTKGILTVCDGGVDHCVQAVGIDTNPFGSYWIVRNQWGTDWGEKGFIRIKYGSNVCNIDYYPTWTTTKRVSEPPLCHLPHPIPHPGPHPTRPPTTPM